MLPNIYLQETTQEFIDRINRLEGNEVPLWGKMNVGQMLSHCCVPYQQILGENSDTPGRLMKFLMKRFFKKAMINDQAYRKNLPTGPAFVRSGVHDVSTEQSKLISYIKTIQELGPEKLEAIPSLSLGKLSSQEWSNMLYKHLDHHLRQFGV
jgi:Protein of unknown function (DUF1569)